MKKKNIRAGEKKKSCSDFIRKKILGPDKKPKPPPPPPEYQMDRA